MQIKNTEQLNKALHVFTTYETYFLTTDGGCLCTECVEKEKALVIDAIESKCDDGWRVCGLDVNYEHVLYCDHCSASIVGSYISDDVVEWHETWDKLNALDANGATMFARPEGHIDEIRIDISTMELAIESIEEENAE